MCKYCADMKEELEDLMKVDYNLGNMGVLTAYISVADNKLDCYLLPNFDDDKHAEFGSVKINYCPMCGRKLNGDS